MPPASVEVSIGSLFQMFCVRPNDIAALAPLFKHLPSYVLISRTLWDP